MWRGGKRKYGYPHQRTDLALDVWLSFPVFVSLQVAVVKFQRLDNKIRFPASGNALGNEFGDPFITESRFFPLVFFPCFARLTPRLTAVVVLPTPPF